MSRSPDSAVAEPKPTRSAGRRAVDRVGDALALRPDRVTVIKPPARWPRLDLRELWHYRELLGRFVWRDVKVRYKQTFIGVAWAILQPFLTMVVFTLVFGKFAKFPNQGQQYPVFLYSGLLLWTYFSSALVGSSMSIVANVPLVTKVYFPRVLLPAGAALVPIVDSGDGVHRSRRADGVLPHGDQPHGVPRAPVPPACRGDGARHRVALRGAQRSLPGRAIRDPFHRADLALRFVGRLSDRGPPA